MSDSPRLRDRKERHDRLRHSEPGHPEYSPGWLIDEARRHDQVEREQREADLGHRIVAYLRARKGRTASMVEIEANLGGLAGHRLDTFVVRNAVWRLIDREVVDFTSRWDVVLVEES
jgi:hypothetical protein